MHVSVCSVFDVPLRVVRSKMGNPFWTTWVLLECSWALDPKPLSLSVFFLMGGTILDFAEWQCELLG